MQEVIVYRSPAEAAAWNFLMSADGFEFISTIAVFVISFIIFDAILRNNANIISRYPLIHRMFIKGYASLFLGAVVAGIYVWWLL